MFDAFDESDTMVLLESVVSAVTPADTDCQILGGGRTGNRGTNAAWVRAGVFSLGLFLNFSCE